VDNSLCKTNLPANAAILIMATQSGLRTCVELFTILLAEAKERGFGIYGICNFVDRLVINRVFTVAEGIKIVSALAINRPKDIPENQHYYWPTGSDYTQVRIEFIDKLLYAYTNHWKEIEAEIKDKVKDILR